MTPPLPVSADVRPDYVWRNLPIGGGGYVTGLVLHPTAPEQLYIRTDVGGIYRFEPAAERWQPLLDGVSYPNRNYLGVDGIALAPSRPGRLAIAAGQHLDQAPSDVLWSDDSGRSWRATGLHRAFGGNQPHRMDGECLAFAPDDAEHLLVGTRQEGLFETRDGARTWRQVSDVPSGQPGIGIRCVVFGREAAYVAVAGEGVFASEAGRGPWRCLPGSPRQVGRLALDADGVLYATARHPGGVWRYDGRWWEITPMNGRNYHALAVDPRDPRRLLVSPLDDPSESQFRLPLFLSTDAGRSWRVVSPQIDWETAAGWMKKTHFAAATAALAFDPHQPGRAYLSDWYAVWRTEDIADRPVSWRALMAGHEEMFLFTLAAPPRGAALLTGMADNVGFRHEQPDGPPTGRIAGGQEATGIDFCEARPDRVVVASGRRSPAHEYAIYVSDDNARTFVRREVPVSADFERLVRVAVSATLPDTFVLLANGDVPHVTRDGGRSWTATEGVPTGALPGRELWCYHHPLAADRVDGQRFYLYHSGLLYVSGDGGWRWVAASGRWPVPATGFITVAAAPDTAGVVAVGLGDAGLWLTEDGGRTVRAIPSLDECLLVGWGRPLGDSACATLFAYGRQGETWAIFRSVNRGETWSVLTSEQQPAPAFPSCLVGDRQVEGRVYLGTTGRGVFYGEPR